MPGRHMAGEGWPTRGRQLLGLLGVGLAVCALTGGCTSTRSFGQLAADARHVPVPPGVTLIKESRATNDGPGFTTTTFEQVTRAYGSSLPCAVLQERWQDALRSAGRSSTLTLEPRLFGASGQAEIVLDDRPEHLGVTLGAITTQGSYIACRTPFVWAFDDPH